MSCPTGSDQMIGPRVDPSCRPFDFTLRFEDIVFGCVLATVFIALSLIQLIGMWWKTPKVLNQSKTLLGTKLCTLTAVLALQLGFVALRQRSASLVTGLSVAGGVLTSAATAVAMVLCFVTHQRSLRPSTLIDLYLSGTILVGIAQVRTIWLVSGPGPISAIITSSLALKVVALFLESIFKVPHDGNTMGRKVAIEPSLGLWSRATFSWLATTFRVGYAKVITTTDLPKLDPRLESRVLNQQLWSAWSRYDKKSKYSLLKACFRAFLLSFFSTVIPRLFVTAFTFTQPFLITVTLRYISNKQHSEDDGKGLIGAWALVYIGIAISNSIYSYQNLRFTTRIRGGLISIISQCTLNTRPVDMGKITAVSLMNTDIARIADGMQMFNEIWASLLDVAIACWLLQRQLSLAFLAPVLLILVFIAATSRVAASASSFQRQWIEKVQERLRFTSTVIGDMKSVKLLGISSVASGIIGTMRLDEIRTSRAFRKIIVATILLSLTPINLAPVVTFAVYVVISVYWKDGTLVTAQAFTSIALVSLLTTPVIVFIQTLPNVLQMKGSFDRIQEYCCYSITHEHQSTVAAAGTKPLTRSTVDEAADSSAVLPCQKGDVREKTAATSEKIQLLTGKSFAWSHEANPFLKDASVTIQLGGINAVTGPTAGGKSALLQSLLGEMVEDPPSPSQRLARTIAYCSQNPWLENCTIRESVLGGSEYDDVFYKKVLWACALRDDINQLDKKDETMVGSRGLNLSGGQKHRIALARAAYSREKVVLLDDVFSSQDQDTSAKVWARVIGPGGLLHQNGSTIIMATTSPFHIANADNIIVVEDGRISEMGPLASLLHSGGYVSGLELELKGFTGSSVAVEEYAESAAGSAPALFPADLPEVDERSKLQDTRRKEGDMSVYKYYLSGAGYFLVGLQVLAMIVWIFGTEFSTIWVKWWSAANEQKANDRVGMYLGVYAALGVISTIGACAAAWTAIISIISKSSVKLHSDLLQAVLGAPFQLFSATDSGEILNRFGQDMELIDMELPSIMVNFSSTVFSCSARVIIIAIFSKYLGIGIPLMGVMLFFLQRFYLQTSRQIRLLNIEAKAPLYSSLTAVTEGLITIRAFGWQRLYQERFELLIDASRQPSYMLSCIQFALGFVLELLTAILAVSLVAVTITLSESFDAGSVGVALVMVVGFSEILTRLITSWTKMETTVGAAARVRRFTMETASEESHLQRAVVPASWPATGSVEVQNLTASYTSGSEQVLRNVSVSIAAGQHIAVCGRSGSGKSSFVLGLMKMIEVDPKSIVCIDGVNVSTLAPSDFRARLNVVPQDPFFVAGSLRLNLDPFSVATDETIENALRRVQLFQTVQEKGGLDADMDAKMWSAGQKQLLCFARALVRDCKLLILDEATGNTDASTDGIIHDIINSDLVGCTVLSIMHRLDHVLSFDRVAVFANGELVEYDAPLQLLQQTTSRLTALYNASKNGVAATD